MNEIYLTEFKCNNCLEVVDKNVCFNCGLENNNVDYINYSNIEKNEYIVCKKKENYKLKQNIYTWSKY